MAHVTRYYISEILKDVCTLLAAVTEAVYPEHRPTGTEELKDEMIVVSIPTEIIDQGAWQRGVLRIELIRKNRSNGIAPTGRLGEMLDETVRKFPIVTRRYSITNPRLVLKGDDGLGFTIWAIQARMMVNTTDSHEYER